MCVLRSLTIEDLSFFLHTSPVPDASWRFRDRNEKKKYDPLPYVHK